MSVVLRNHVQPFRPLRGGIAVVNGATGPLGTLGCIATTDGADRWLLSAYHVLQGTRAVLADGDPIFQPVEDGVLPAVAQTRADRASQALDVAAAEVLPGVDSTDEVLGIGRLGAVAEPAIGMRVMKSGIATGVTEGVVLSIAGDMVTIGLPDGFPSRYELSAISDSGAVWVEATTAAPVALHVAAGTAVGPPTARAVRMSQVLQALGLQLL